MLFFIYSALFIIALPFILLTFLYKSRKEIGYRQRWRERFALTKPLQKQSVVIHAASVGEVLLVVPLVKQLLAQFPNVPITITTFTPGGSERVQALFGNRVQHCYLPFDLPFLMKRFCNNCSLDVLLLLKQSCGLICCNKLRTAIFHCFN